MKNKKESKELVEKKEKQIGGLGKWLRQTSLTVLLILIIIAVAIGINIAVEEANLADFDFTQDKIYSLSDMSKQIAQGINQDVEIIIVNMPDVEDFAKKYNSVNDKIKVEVIEDVTARPDLTDKYSLTADSYAIIVKSNKKDKILSSADLYTYDYTTYEQKDITEEALTNAIIDVTTENNSAVANSLIAQAKAARAWTYLNLGLVYGPMYNPNGTNDTQTIPYRTESQPLVANPDRATTAELFQYVNISGEKILHLIFSCQKPY